MSDVGIIAGRVRELHHEQELASLPSRVFSSDSTRSDSSTRFRDAKLTDMASASHILTLVSSVALRLSVYIFLRWVSACAWVPEPQLHSPNISFSD